MMMGLTAECLAALRRCRVELRALHAASGLAAAAGLELLLLLQQGISRPGEENTQHFTLVCIQSF